MTSHIRIPDIAPVTQAVADGSRAAFAFSFPIFQAADLEIHVNSTLITGGYSVVGEGSSTGGAVIFAVAPAAGARVTLRRKQVYARTDDFLDERAPTPHELNDAVDQNVAAIQELAEDTSRAVRRSLTADLTQPVDLTLPEPESGKVIGWNGAANALVNLVQPDSSDILHKSQNLADLPDKAQAWINLGLRSAASHAASDFATAAQGVKADSALQASDIGTTVQAHDADLDWVAANLSAAGRALIHDADAAAQRLTLGLKTVADTGDYTDLINKPALGSAAPLNIDTDGTLAANSDSLIASQKAVKTYVDARDNAIQAGALLKAQNLADLPDTAKARTNLQLGTAAREDIGTSGNKVPLLNGANTYGAPQTPASQTLTDAATVAIAITAQVWTLTTSAARTIGAPTGGVAGTFYFLEIVTNGYVPSWNTAFDWGLAGAPSLLAGTCGFDIFYDGVKYRITTRFTGGV